MSEAKLTPMMKQYREMKDLHQDAFLFFRLGDFYEMFEEDAIKASQILGITLTKRKNNAGEIPMCGVPYHSAETYIRRLIHAGHKVALCEQTSDPNLPGIVEREVVRVITPGTYLGNADEVVVRRIASICFHRKKKSAALVWLDFTSGQIQTKVCNEDEIVLLCNQLAPQEILYDLESNQEILRSLQNLNMPMTERIVRHEAKKRVLDFFGIATSFPLEIPDEEMLWQGLSLVLDYIEEQEKKSLSHIQFPQYIADNDSLILGGDVLSHLEIFASDKKNTKFSLFGSLGIMKNPMGIRHCANILHNPTRNKIKIEERLDRVEYGVKNSHLRSEIEDIIAQLPDVEKLLARISSQQANPRDIVALRESLKHFETLFEILNKTPLGFPVFSDAIKDIISLLEKSLRDDAPASFNDGGYIRRGYNSDLDMRIQIIEDTNELLEKFQHEEQSITGIHTLKVIRAKMIGFCIEVSKSAVTKVPDSYVLKQTLTNGSRFITEKLQTFEKQYISAEAERIQIELNIFHQLREEILVHISQLQVFCQHIAEIDCIVGFAKIASEHKWVRPNISDSGRISIQAGKHPMLSLHQVCIANNVDCNDQKKLAIITGPNMAGKSTYLRMIGLIIFLMHIGSFVPAENAQIPILDRLFTRVGAGDSLATGMSTFMVEMAETAHILRYATPQSLILLDEIGRGTSTYDGVSIAWSVIEYIHNVLKTPTFFATHYHELIDLAAQLPHAENLSVKVSKTREKIIFLYEIIQQPSPQSYGIEVAKLAGLPQEVVSQAREILNTLEQHAHDIARSHGLTSDQLNIFGSLLTKVDEAEGKMNHDTEIHTLVSLITAKPSTHMTPIESLMLIEKLQKYIADADFSA